MSASLSVHREREGRIELVGSIDRRGRTMSFSYDEDYLASPHAAPLSCSLPLYAEPFPESRFRPYFEGLLPEGTARRAFAQEAGIPEEDYLSILADSGLDCVGDVIVNLNAYRSPHGYEPLSLGEIRKIVSRPPSLAEASAASRLSLAGTQGKIGLFHDPSCSLEKGWSRPIGGAASTHVLKTESVANLSIIECLCMACAAACGVRSAETRLIDLGSPVVCSKRFDRLVSLHEGRYRVTRLHQEDLAQALGILPGSKYAELEPSSAAALAGFLRQKAASPLHELQELVRIICFNYLIGNCDNHLKNLSVLYSQDGFHVALAPAYDLVCTTIFDRFTRTMGMRLGNASAIDEVEPHSFDVLASDLGVAPAALKRASGSLLASAVPSLEAAGNRLEHDFPVAPYLADDIAEDMAPRLRVLEAFCSQ